MSIDEKCTCKACKNTVFHCQICKFFWFLLASSSWLLKLPSNTGRHRSPPGFGACLLTLFLVWWYEKVRMFTQVSAFFICQILFRDWGHPTKVLYLFVSCCAVIYRAFDIVQLHYSFLLLSLMSSLVVLTSMICLGKHCNSRETNHMQNVTSFHVMSFQFKSLHVTLCHVIYLESRHIGLEKCPSTSCHVMSCHVKASHVMSFCVVSFRVKWAHITPCHVKSYQYMSSLLYYSKSRHVTSLHVMSRHAGGKSKPKQFKRRVTTMVTVPQHVKY